MRNVLLLIGGALIGYGIYSVYKSCQKKPVLRQPVMEPQRVDVYQKTEFVPTPNPMITHWDARPEALFAPPKAYIYSSDPSVTDLITPTPDF